MNHTNTDSSRFVVKVSCDRKANTLRKWSPDFWFLSETHWTDKTTGIAPQLFMSRKEAVSAIRREKRLLKSEWEQYKKDLRLLKKNGLLRRYVGLEGFLMRQYNGYILWQNELKYEVVEISPEQLKTLFGDESHL